MTVNLGEPKHNSIDNYVKTEENEYDPLDLIIENTRRSDSKFKMAKLKLGSVGYVHKQNLMNKETVSNSVYRFNRNKMSKWFGHSMKEQG